MTPDSTRFLSNLAKRNHKVWTKKIRAALISANGHVGNAAKLLSVSTSMMWRWIKKEPELLEGTGHKQNPAQHRNNLIARILDP